MDIPSFIWISPLGKLRRIKAILEAGYEVAGRKSSVKRQEELFESFCYVDDFIRGVEAYKKA